MGKKITDIKKGNGFKKVSSSGKMLIIATS